MRLFSSSPSILQLIVSDLLLGPSSGLGDSVVCGDVRGGGGGSGTGSTVHASVQATVHTGQDVNGGRNVHIPS